MKHLFHAPYGSSAAKLALPLAAVIACSAVNIFALPAAAPAAADPASQNIDRLVEEGLVKAGLKPNPPASDEIFVRRIHLDIIGRIPTAQEAADFLNSKAPDKRSKLIDQLLMSEGYVSHFYNFWADILRVKSNPNEGGQEGSGDAYAAWLKGELRKNTPYNKLVYQMLTANGYIWDNGAVGYYMRDAGMPLDNMANTCQIFLGTRVACAQCHDHPFDEYHQRDFYEMAAYTTGVNTRVQPRDIISEATGKKVGKRAAEKLVQPGVAQELEKLLEPLSYGVRGNPKAEQKLPDDYRGDPKNPNPREGKPGEIVKAVPVFGKRSEIKTNKHILENYAGWMTSPENQTFTVIIANRLWKQAMGLGLIEPVDDIKKVDLDKHTGDASKLASNPALMSFLTQHMKSCNYDMKRFLRTIYNTRAYQREATTGDIASIEEYKFPGPVLRRLTSEQLWDSMVTFVIPYPDLRRGSLAYTGQMSKMKAEADKLQDEWGGNAKALLDLATGRAKVEADFDKQVEPARKKMADARAKNDKKALETAQAEVERIEALRFDARKKVADEQKSKTSKMASTAGLFSQKKPVAMTTMETDKMMKKETAVETTPSAADDKWQGFGNEWVRASELPSPAPGGHFLREFGQSDRDIIQNSTRDSSVTQALLMLNGSLFNQVTANNTQLGQALSAARTPDEKRDQLYLTILSRLPNDREKALVAKQLQQDGNASGFKKIAWALLNTREFSFLQ
ncbi:MAG: DUF1549 domain-containing protein [Verrucomicrobiales bacterium]